MTQTAPHALLIGGLMPSGLNLFSVDVCFFQANILWRKLSLEDLGWLCKAKFSANIPPKLMTTLFPETWSVCKCVQMFFSH